MHGYWLFKTEPSDYSFARLQRERRTEWSGVKNTLALRHLRAIRKGDEILIYHTGSEKCAVGVARARNDAADDSVTVEALRALPRAVPLGEIKADPEFAEFDLVRISRLSVMPISDRLWRKILEKANLPPSSE